MHIPVSAVIPAYNAEKFIHVTIESALAQTYALAEIIVVDDGSSDRTAEVAGKFPKTRVIRRPNGGQGAARNTGIREAIGEWIALLDHDDTWREDKTEIQIRYAATGVDFEALWQRRAFVTPSGALVRKRTLEEVGGFSESRAVMGVEDLNLWLRIAMAGWRFVKSEGGLYRWNSVGNQSSNDLKMLAAELANVEQIGSIANRQDDVEYLKRLIRLEYARNLIGAGNVTGARDLLNQCYGGLACRWLRLATMPGMKRFAHRRILEQLLAIESWLGKGQVRTAVHRISSPQ